MVMPMSPLMAGGSMPDELLEKLRQAKICIILLLLFAIGRCVTGDPLGAVNDFFAACFGVFLMRDDRHLSRCYKFLLDTPIGICAGGGGGLTCLLPFIFLAVLNALFDGMQLVQLVVALQAPEPHEAHKQEHRVHFDRAQLIVLLPWLAGSLCTQAWAAAVCWRVYKSISRNPLDDYMFDAEAGGNYVAAPQADAPRQQGFVPFSGPPHRI